MLLLVSDMNKLTEELTAAESLDVFEVGVSARLKMFLACFNQSGSLSMFI